MNEVDEKPVDETLCDHCEQPVYRSPHGGWWEGEDDTSECPVSPEGHTVNGKQR